MSKSKDYAPHGRAAVAAWLKDSGATDGPEIISDGNAAMHQDCITDVLHDVAETFGPEVVRGLVDRALANYEEEA
jgi:hypothetical protein